MINFNEYYSITDCKNCLITCSFNGQRENVCKCPQNQRNLTLNGKSLQIMLLNNF